MQVQGSTWRTLLLVAVLVSVVMLLYALSFSGPFFYDDIPAIAEHPAAHSWAALWDFFTFRGLMQRPLTMLTYRLDWIVGGGSAFSFHFTNAVLHAVTAIALFLWARGLGYRSAIWAALLFAVHPLAVSSVAYISGRGYVLGTCFTLFMLIAAGRRRFVLACVAAFMALLSKQLFLLSFVLLTAMWIHSSPRRSVRRRLLTVGVVFFGLFIVYASTLLVRQAIDATIPARTFFLMQPILWWRVVRLCLIPYSAGLFYGMEIVPRHLVLWSSVAYASTVAAVTFIAGWFLRIDRESKRWRWLVPLIWFGLFLLCLHGLVPKNELIAQWRLYPLLPPACLIVMELIGVLALRCWRTLRSIPAVVLLVLVIGTVGTVTFFRTRAWGDELTAWRMLRQTNPRSAQIRLNEATALAHDGQWSAASQVFRSLLVDLLLPERASTTHSNSMLVSESLTSLGSIKLLEGRPAEAQQRYREALRWNPTWGDAWMGLYRSSRELGDERTAKAAVTFAREMKGVQ